MECYTPATILQHASRTAEGAEVSISIEAVLTTLRAFDAENVPSLAPTFTWGQWPKTGAPGRFLARNGWAEI